MYGISTPSSITSHDHRGLSNLLPPSSTTTGLISKITWLSSISRKTLNYTLCMTAQTVLVVSESDPSLKHSRNTTITTLSTIKIMSILTSIAVLSLCINHKPIQLTSWRSLKPSRIFPKSESSLMMEMLIESSICKKNNYILNSENGRILRNHYVILISLFDFCS